MKSSLPGVAVVTCLVDPRPRSGLAIDGAECFAFGRQAERRALPRDPRVKCQCGQCDAIDAIANIAVSVNSAIENIGARRLQTVMERVLDEISFDATDKSGEAIAVDAAYVQGRVGDLAKNADLSKFIL